MLLDKYLLHNAVSLSANHPWVKESELRNDLFQEDCFILPIANPVQPQLKFLFLSATLVDVYKAQRRKACS